MGIFMDKFSAPTRGEIRGERKHLEIGCDQLLSQEDYYVIVI